jgi:hypothetical protein
MMLSVDQLTPDMVVARDVTNLNGALLLPAGSQLTPQRLRTLKMWGIAAVEVRTAAEGNTGPEPAEAPPTPELLEAAAAHVNQRLRHVTAEWKTVECVRELAIRRRAEQMARAGKGTEPTRP